MRSSDNSTKNDVWKEISTWFSDSIAVHSDSNKTNKTHRLRSGLIKTWGAPVFSNPQVMPVEYKIRHLKTTIDALLLKVMHEPLDINQDYLSRRVKRARTGLEALNRLTPELWCRLATYAIYENHLEQATIITDRLLMQGVCSANIYVVAMLAQLHDRRFQEARDALMSVWHLVGENVYMDTLKNTLDAIVAEQVSQTPYVNKVPTRTYVLVDQHNGVIDFQLNEVIRCLKANEDLILVQDRMDAYDIKKHYGDQICSMETEHKIWQQYEGTHRNIRVILKNDNNGHYMKGLKMGVRKALATGTQDVLTHTNGTWSNIIAGLVKQTDNLTKPTLSTEALTCLNTHTPKKRIALFGVTKDDYGHGVPIVMSNIVRALSDSPFTFSYVVNDFDTNRIKYFDETRSVSDFENRADFINFVHKHEIQFEILHFHSWHYSDHYKPFRSERDALGIDILIEQLGSPKVIYTDHSNPTEDLRRIREHHGIDYSSLSDNDKEKFLQSHDLRNFSVKDWKRGWDATSILSKRQIMQLADYVTHVSAIQRQEEQQLILPHYSINGKHVVIWNGTDLLDYRHLPEVITRSKQLKKERQGQGQSVLYVGRAEKEKGIFDLAEAIAQLRATDFHVNLIFVGKFDADLRQQLNQTSTQQNLYTGLINDRTELAAHYVAADLIAQPTWGECFNQVISEGLAVGTPSVVSDISGPREVYIDNGIAIGHQPQVPASLAQEIKRGLTDGKLRSEIIKKGGDFVAKHLSARNMVTQYADIYHS